MQGEHKTHLIALRCSEPPVGHARWTLRLLVDQMVELGYINEQLVKFDPDDDPSWSQYGDLLFQSKHYKATISAHNSVLADDPNRQDIVKK